MSNEIVYINNLDKKLTKLKEETQGLVAWNATQCNMEIDAISSTTISLQCDIYQMQEKLASLEANLRSVMDAIADRPKQKWLWEIFEPIGDNIDFSYIL